MKIVSNVVFLSTLLTLAVNATALGESKAIQPNGMITSGVPKPILHEGGASVPANRSGRPLSSLNQYGAIDIKLISADGTHKIAQWTKTNAPASKKAIKEALMDYDCFETLYKSIEGFLKLDSTEELTRVGETETYRFEVEITFDTKGESAPEKLCASGEASVRFVARNAPINGKSPFIAGTSEISVPYSGDVLIDTIGTRVSRNDAFDLHLKRAMTDLKFKEAEIAAKAKAADKKFKDHRDILKTINSDY